MISAKGLVYKQSWTNSSVRGSQQRVSRDFKTTMGLILAHLPLGVILYNTGSFALIHPIAAFAVGLAWAFKKRNRLDRVALAIGYLVGAEVLWRMARVPVPWEFGKYGAAAIMIVALINRRRNKIPQLPLIYFVALIPACIFPLVELTISDARGQLSSNLSGPFLLAVSCWFFAHVKTTPLRLRRVMVAILIPLLSVGCATLFYTVTAEQIQFTSESNFATSGGFGPNQVSAMLGLGVFVAAACLMSFKLDMKLKVVLAVSATFLAAQSVMTFSRGGIYNAVGASVALMLFQFRNFAEGVKRLIPMLGLVAVFTWLIFPSLDDFTGGKLQERFEDTGTTNRIDIAESDLAIFLEYPIWGAGVGLGNEYRRQLFGYGAGSHTEFSRLISEHGIFGFGALSCLCAMTVINIKRQQTTFGRALIVGVSVWGALFMINAGMRLAAPSFLWGLTFITFGFPRRLRPLPRSFVK